MHTFSTSRDEKLIRKGLKAFASLNFTNVFSLRGVNKQEKV